MFGAGLETRLAGVADLPPETAIESPSVCFPHGQEGNPGAAQDIWMRPNVTTGRATFASCGT